MFKLVDGTRTCMHEMLARDDAFVPDMVDGVIDIQDHQRQLYGTIAYVRGLDTHPLRGHARVIHTLESALQATGTMTAPEEESTTDEDKPEEEPHTSEAESATPEYNVLDEAPPSPTPGPSHAPLTFEDILRATREAAARADANQDGDPPGDWIQEAPPTPPTPPGPPMDIGYHADDEEPSPFRTRSGAIRGPPAPPRKRGGRK